MATNNSNNNQYTNNADGFSLAGGTTQRTLTATGSNITLTGSGSNTYTMPSATDTLVGRASTDILTNKTLTAPTIDQVNQTTAPGVKLQLSVQKSNSGTISNTITSGVYIQYGWGQILGPGTSTMSSTVTFPTAYTTILGVSISWIGYKSGGTVAADITQFTTQIGSGIVIEAGSPTTSGFTMKAASTGIFGGAYHGYSWVAWGI